MRSDFLDAYSDAETPISASAKWKHVDKFDSEAVLRIRVGLIAMIRSVSPKRTGRNVLWTYGLWFHRRRALRP